MIGYYVQGEKCHTLRYRGELHQLIVAGTGGGKFPTIDDLRKAAQRRIPSLGYETVAGGAGQNLAVKRNADALDAIEMVPRYGVMPELPPVGVELFGRRYTAPLGVAPMGSPIVV